MMCLEINSSHSAKLRVADSSSPLFALSASLSPISPDKSWAQRSELPQAVKLLTSAKPRVQRWCQNHYLQLNEKHFFLFPVTQASPFSIIFIWFHRVWGQKGWLDHLICLAVNCKSLLRFSQVTLNSSTHPHRQPNLWEIGEMDLNSTWGSCDGKELTHNAVCDQVSPNSLSQCSRESQTPGEQLWTPRVAQPRGEVFFWGELWSLSSVDPVGALREQEISDTEISTGQAAQS